MTDKISDFKQTATDWRAQLKLNNKRTWLVMGTFVLIYLSLGVLIDLLIYSGQYPHASLWQISKALFTLHLTPFATIITAIIAVISIFVTLSYHDKLMLLGTKYHEVTGENADNLAETQLYNVVEEMKVAAGLRYVPKVYVIDADYMNAFASGYSEKSAMIAVTKGLLHNLNRAELCAVVAHEMSHIRHGDIKLTLVASVLANLLLIIIDILFYSVIFSNNRQNNSNKNQLVIVVIVLRYALPLITVLLMLYLSRTREYMADAGCVELMRDNEPLASALLKIRQGSEENKEKFAEDYQKTPHEAVRRAAYIFDPIQAGIEPVKSLSDSFSTHPGILKRLAAIGFTKPEKEKS